MIRRLIILLLIVGCEETTEPNLLVGSWKQIILEQYENINCNGTSIIIDFTSEALFYTWGYENERVWTTDSDGTLTYVSSKIYSNGIIESETLIGTWEDKGGSLCIVLEGYDNNDTDDCVDCSDYIINGNTLTVNQTCTTGCNIYEFVKQ